MCNISECPSKKNYNDSEFCYRHRGHINKKIQSEIVSSNIVSKPEQIPEVDMTPRVNSSENNTVPDKIDVNTDVYQYEDLSESELNNVAEVKVISFEERQALASKFYEEQKKEAAPVVEKQVVAPVKEETVSITEIINKKLYDRRSYKLCMMINNKWFDDSKNIWKITGFFAKDLHKDFNKQLETYLCVLKQKTRNFNIEQAIKDFNQWITCKYAPMSESAIRSIVGSHPSYQVWKDRYIIEEVKEKSKDIDTDEEETPLGEAFDKTFSSKMINSELEYILKHMGKTFDEFKRAICDKKYVEGIELSFWAKEHCTIINHAYNDFRLDYRFFENILKTIKFYKVEIANRFIAYFIHEFFVFGERAEDCFQRAKISDANHLSIKDYSITEFNNISISIKSKMGFSSSKLSDLLKSIPFHKFTNSCYIWGHNPDDMDAFSKAIPFPSKVLDEDITESDLLADWLYYMKDIICNKDEATWIWFRSYLANITHQPNKRTEVMVLLYSMETRLGKSTLKYWIDQVFGLSNVSKVESITDAFGERGGPTLVGKKVVWFEELTDKKSTFRACMDRMKTAITETRTTYKKLYHNLNETDNTNEYIAATNHLVGVLENRHAVLNVSAERQNDRVFYTKLRAGLTTNEVNKTITYLKKFTTSLPMAIIETKAYKSMLTNSNESITQFIVDIKSTECCISSKTTEKTNGDNYMYVKRDDLYRTYQTWCEKRGETILPMSRFKEKLSHYDSSIMYKKIKADKSSFFAFTFPLDYFVPLEAVEED